MENYKGIFYKKEKEKKYYEGGAHFKYLDLVNALIILQKNNDDNLTINNSMDDNIKKGKIISTKNNYIKSEGNHYHNNIQKKKEINSNSITINNCKNIIINNKTKTISTDKNNRKQMIQRMRFFESFKGNSKIPFNKLNLNNDKYNSINSIRSILSKNKSKINKTNNNLKLIINNNKNTLRNKLPLVESFYFNQFINKKNFDENFIKNDDMNEIKTNRINKNKIFLPTKKANNNENNIFSFKSLDNHKNFDTINNLGRRSTNKFGRIFRDYSMNKKENFN